MSIPVPAQLDWEIGCNWTDEDEDGNLLPFALLDPNGVLVDNHPPDLATSEGFDNNAASIIEDMNSISSTITISTNTNPVQEVDTTDHQASLAVDDGDDNDDQNHEQMMEDSLDLIQNEDNDSMTFGLGQPGKGSLNQDNEKDKMLTTNADQDLDDDISTVSNNEEEILPSSASTSQEAKLNGTSVEISLAEKVHSYGHIVVDLTPLICNEIEIPISASSSTSAGPSAGRKRKAKLEHRLVEEFEISNPDERNGGSTKNIKQDLTTTRTTDPENETGKAENAKKIKRKKHLANVSKSHRRRERLHYNDMVMYIDEFESLYEESKIEMDKLKEENVNLRSQLGLGLGLGNHRS